MKTSLLLIAFLFGAIASVVAKPIVVGSKKFTESYVLGEIAKTVLERAGFQVEERPGMGGTIILWQALRSGQIDLYPEYTGTIGEEIVKTKQPLEENEMRRAWKNSASESQRTSDSTTLTRWSCAGRKRRNSVFERSAICASTKI